MLAKGPLLPSWHLRAAQDKEPSFLLIDLLESVCRFLLF